MCGQEEAAPFRPGRVSPPAVAPSRFNPAFRRDLPAAGPVSASETTTPEPLPEPADSSGETTGQGQSPGQMMPLRLP